MEKAVLRLFLIFILSKMCNSGKITVMTFNCWFGGDNVYNGVEKIAKHIKLIDPDIVSLQEMDLNKVTRVVSLLNASIWHICDNTNAYYNNDPYIITKFPIVRQYSPGAGVRNVGCKVLTDYNRPETALNLWNWHLAAYPYGPYDACLFNTAKSEQDLTNSEYDTFDYYSYKRLNSVHRMLQHEPFAQSMSRSHFEPMILTGDFNSPSHLDWVESSRFSHCNWAYDWPVTKLLSNNGFLDSYRYMYPNPATHSGVTWSPIYEFNADIPSKVEPLDRIDMILFKGTLLQPITSRVYDGTEKIFRFPYHVSNDWPSDHSSVVSEFYHFV